MNIEFTKMHGAGNDYIYIDCFTQRITNPSALAVKMSDRHFGVGGDGIVLILPSEKADARMRMFNADGSEGMMCGNAIRCVGKFLYDNGIVNNEVVNIETESGIKKLILITDNNICNGAVVDMGKACFEPSSIPLNSLLPEIVIEGYDVTAVSMGNPHGVIFTKNITQMDIGTIAKKIQNSSYFPKGVNVSFAEIKDGSIELRVYERGSGETLACGTGACATVAAAVKNGLIGTNEQIMVNLIGGTLKISCSETYEMIMQGEAVKVFGGNYEFED